MQSLTYISRSEINPLVAEDEVKRVIKKAQLANPPRRLTGGLIFTGLHFAQVIEGEPDQIDSLMDKVMTDPRHSDVTIIARRPIEKRFFYDWSMAYSGEPTWIDEHIEPLFSGSLAGPARDEAEAHVAQLVTQFSLLRRCTAQA